MIKEYLIVFLQVFFDLFNWAIFVYVFASLFTGTGNRFYDFLADLTKPVLKLAKKITPNLGQLDLSPMIAMFSLELIKNLLVMLLKNL